MELCPHLGMWTLTGRESGELVRTSGGEGGRLLWVSSTFAVDQPTLSELNPHPLLSQTQMCLVFLKPSLLCWDIYGIERNDSWRGPSKDLTGINHTLPTSLKKQHCQISFWNHLFQTKEQVIMKPTKSVQLHFLKHRTSFWFWEERKTNQMYTHDILCPL